MRLESIHTVGFASSHAPPETAIHKPQTIRRIPKPSTETLDPTTYLSIMLDSVHRVCGSRFDRANLTAIRKPQMLKREAHGLKSPRLIRMNRWNRSLLRTAIRKPQTLEREAHGLNSQRWSTRPELATMEQDKPVEPEFVEDEYLT